MSMTRKVHLTGQIKPSTRNAVLDQLAAIADGIIRERSQHMTPHREGEFGLVLTEDEASAVRDAWTAHFQLVPRKSLWQRLVA